MNVRTAATMLLSASIVVVVSGSPALAARQDASPSLPDAFDAKQRRLALGVSMPDGRDLSQLDAFRASIGGTRVATWTIWRNFGSPNLRAFPMAAAKAARKRHAVPLIWWEPITPGDWTDSTYTRNQNIIDGDHDAYIRDFALDAKRFGTSILLRFAHQANSDYLPWGWDYSKTDDNTQATFKAAWRHVVRIFRDVGATNVKWVWSVATQTCAGNCLKRPLGYPGNRWVDYMAFTWENWGKAPPGSEVPSKPWISMLNGFKPIVKRLSAVSKKPILAVAFASAPGGGNRARWIYRGYQAVYKKLPRVKGIMYLNVDLSPNHRDWSLSGSPLKAYARIAAMPRFKGRIR